MRRYCLDANAFIEPWNKYYSMKRCPQYWEILDQLGQKNIVFCPDQVKREIDKVNDGLKEWLASMPHLIREETEDVQQHVREILRVFPRLISVGADRSMADPWVIGHAMAEKAVVVTKEHVAKPQQANTRVKIPDVCKHFNLPCINEFQFIDEIGIDFSASLGQS